ncbi:MAG: leucine-rich repeat domain-containing protein [Oscillospiraceae bacterium]|nr:leucine-rich repeat domain-containing protein [Oscillospiraceae bacterium]
MKKLKVLLASMTALCLLVGNLPVVKQVMPFTIYASAKDTEEFATSGTCGENLTWNFEKSTGTLTISGTGAMEDWYYTSPGWYNLCETIKKVIIEDGVTTIGVGAFWECSALESIIIPDSVTRIESGTFIDTPWLERKRKENPLVIINGILIDGKTCKQKKITIPDGVKIIGNYAFDDCNALESITIPDSVTVIKANAFSDCSALESIVIPDSVTTIEACAFYNCFALESIVIPDSVTTIGGDAFKRTQWLKDKIEENPLVIVNGILINGQTCEKKLLFQKM